MSILKAQDQGISELSQMDCLPIVIESFLIDRKAQGLSSETILFYQKKMKYFIKFCEAQAVTQAAQLTPDLIRRYLLELSDRHNPGGVHACFRTLRTLLLWVEQEEIMPDTWKNPICRVNAPKLPNEPLKPIALPDVLTLVDVSALQKLIGLSDPQVLRRYLAQTDQNIHTAPMMAVQWIVTYKR